ncbi:phage tail protein [Domibacillus antri]|uniref:Phage tail protein n=1 Tax=Domibacillus antri TaxID=1714264 RepID=A0A1Q8Q254_9BACI|nr:phage tail sheath family protein [Domibacillus antri]OLN21402.1 phage tail protein [Domibacillus antri]
MTYNHGIRTTERSTSVSTVATVVAGLPVVIGTAPIHLAETLPSIYEPILVYTKSEAIAKLGYSDEWGKFTLCEFMKSHFDLFEVAPVVFINTLNPETHTTTVTDGATVAENGVYKINQSGVLLNTVTVKAGTTAAVEGTDYVLSFDDAGYAIITPITGGALTSAAAVTASYSYLNTTLVTDADIIGGTNSTTGQATGLELINSVFPKFRLVPGQILAPGFSQKPSIAAVMAAKATNINSVFKAVTLNDADTEAAAVYTAVPQWKNDNNYSAPAQFVFWPKVKMDADIYHLSTQAAAVSCLTDAVNGDIPFVSPSNKPIKAVDTVLKNGQSVTLDLPKANYLNGQGIVTALNFVGGWKLWGNRTAAYPASGDVKDNFIPLRRMFNWVNNTIILTFWEKVDNPSNRTLIDNVVDTLNIWLNGLSARGALLGGRVEFRQSENPTTDLVNGKVRLNVFIASPTPAEDLEFILEFDMSYLGTLFN